MSQKTLFSLTGLLVVLSLVLGACNPSATPTEAVPTDVPATQAPTATEPPAAPAESAVAHRSAPHAHRVGVAHDAGRRTGFISLGTARGTGRTGGGAHRDRQLRRAGPDDLSL